MAAGSDAQPADSRRSAGPEDTQRDLRPTVVAELDLAGLTDAVEIGRGGFGTVYRCEQTELDRTVAVKVLRSDVLPSDRARFLREERAMGRLTGHPNIVDVLTVDVTVSGRPFIVMPFHSRGSLDDLVRRDGPLAWQETVRIGVKLAGAIASAHALGILHRDVKPANILVTSYGEPQLTDFGVARLRGGFESAVGEIAGSPAFMAPELLSGAQPDERSDVYSLGATLFALLTGHAAFERRAGEQVLAQFVRITSQPVRSLWTATPPDDVSAAVEAAMAIEPGERPASAAEFGEMLQAVLVRHGLPSGEMTLPVSHADRQARIDHAPDRPLPAASGSGAVGQTQVTRERLVGLVADARSTLVRADAGFGKTAVLGQVRDLLRARNIPSIWLDGRTTSAVPFDRRLARALDAARGRPVVLVDDWHLIDADAASAAIRILEQTDPAKAADLRVRVARWFAAHPEATTSRREHSTPRSW